MSHKKNSIPDQAEQTEKNESMEQRDTGTNRIVLGAEYFSAGVSSEESYQIEKLKEMEVIYPIYDQIQPSDENKYSMSDIEALAESIRDVGILNPIILKKVGEGRYAIVAGERRYRAIGKNIEDGYYAADKPFRCHLFDPSLIDLPLDDADKEEYVRHTENAEQRDKSDGDKLLQMRGLKRLYEKLREKGALSGVKTREILAADMKISESAVAQYNKIENQGSEELQQALIDGNVKITAAVDIASMPKEQQADLINSVLSSKAAGEPQEISKMDIKKYQHKKENEKDPKAVDVEADVQNEDSETKEKQYVITDKVIKADLKELFKNLKKSNVTLNEEQYIRYLDRVRSLISYFE